MITQQAQKVNSSLILKPAIFGLLTFASSSAIAASTNSADSTNSWSLIIVFLVFAATAGSAVLNVAAIRHWDRNWGLVSVLPLFCLLLWGAFIVVAKQMDESAHELWALEIFAWAMINMIYMVTAMTAKRMFAKRDDEASSKP